MINKIIPNKKSLPNHWLYPKKIEPLDDYHKKDISLPIALSLIRQNISAEDSTKYLDAKLNLLSSPFLLLNMNKAIDRIWQAIEKKEKIIIHGDYDSDGTTAAVLTHWVLKAYGADVEIFIPNRLIYDHSATPKSIDFLKKKNVKLIITVDCGITSIDAINYAKKLNIDFIVTDHHIPDFNNLPQAIAIINPLLDKKNIELHCLAGVGVAFKLCHAFTISRKEIKIPIDLREGLDLVAFGTIADFCPIIGENRILIKNGMKLISLRHRLGFKALSDACNLNEDISPTDIMRILAPKINASGRIGQPEISSQLLMTNNYNEACLLTRKLNKFNHERQRAEQSAFKAAKKQVPQALNDCPSLIIIVGENWHPGIIGTITTKLTKRYSSPCVVLNIMNTDTLYHGSGRSGLSNLNLLDLLTDLDDDITVGGHSMAFGICVPKNKIELFKSRVYQRVSKQKKTIDDKIINAKNIIIDGVVKLNFFNEKFNHQLIQFGPFNIRSPEPAYIIKNVQLKNIVEKNAKQKQGDLIDSDNNCLPFILNKDLFNKYNLSQKNYTVVISPIVTKYNNQETNYKLFIKDII